MKYIRVFLITQLFLFLLLDAKIITLAMGTGFSTESLSADEKNSFLSHFDISMLIAEPQKKPIECFDVSEEGLIAVGYSDSFMSTKKMICIYADDGTFLYGYQFEDYGVFGVEWDRDRLIIYLVRSARAVAVNPAGEIEAVSEIQNTIENHSYWRKSVFSTERLVEDTKYTLKNNMGILNLFASAYSQVVIEKSGGEKAVIYDAGIYHLVSMLVIVVVVLLMICIAIICLTREVIKQRQTFKTKSSVKISL